jgi:hypothetical protein
MSISSQQRNACAFLIASQRRCVHVAILRPVTPDDCAICPHYTGQARGLGDVVHSIALVTGIAAVVERSGVDCGCAKRRATLNAVFPNPDKG